MLIGFLFGELVTLMICLLDINDINHLFIKNHLGIKQGEQMNIEQSHFGGHYLIDYHYCDSNVLEFLEPIRTNLQPR